MSTYPLTTGERSRGLLTMPGWAVFLMLAVGAPWAMYSIAVLMSGGNSQWFTFSMAADVFVVCAIGYLGMHGMRGAAWCSATVLLTIRVLIECVIVPCWRFAKGYDQIDSFYVLAMALTCIGFIAFWTGSLIFMKRVRVQFTPRLPPGSSRIGLVCLGLLVLGLLGNVVMWRAGLYVYTADSNTRQASAGFIQWLGFLAALLTAAMIASGIEVLGKRSTEPLTKAVFWLSVVFSLGFGVMSGSKEGVLLPLVQLTLLYVITRSRIPRTTILLPLLLVLMYPFVNAYRDNLNGGYRTQSNTIEGLASTVGKTVNDVIEGSGSTTDATQGGFRNSLDRLSLLTSMRNAITIFDAASVDGGEKVWLAPVYPVIPRFLWKSKPVLNKGARVNAALGGGETSSAAISPVADLYIIYGIFGVPIGMFLYGVGLQLYMNWIGGKQSERVVFIHLSILVSLIDFENDVVGLIASSIQVFLVILVISYIIYGRRSSSSSVRSSVRVLTTSRRGIGHVIHAVYHLRKPTGTLFSLERVFGAVRRCLPSDIQAEVRNCRFESRGFARMLLNLLEAPFRQGELNHVTGDIGYIVLGLSKRKTVLTINDCVGLQSSKGLSRRALLWLWYLLPIRSVAAVTVISEFTRNEVARYTGCDPELLHVIYCPVPDKFVPWPKVFDAQEPVILQVGTFEHNKNICRVAEALCGVPCRMEVIGRLTARQKQALESNGVRYTEQWGLSDEQVVERYRRCDLVVFASLYEGFGMPIVEANATGRPVVTSNLGPMPEVAGQAACLVDPYDPASIRGGVLRVINDAAYREQLVANGFENVKRFRAEVVAAQYAALYRQVLARAEGREALRPSERDSEREYESAMAAGARAVFPGEAMTRDKSE